MGAEPDIEPVEEAESEGIVFELVQFDGRERRSHVLGATPYILLLLGEEGGMGKLRVETNGPEAAPTDDSIEEIAALLADTADLMRQEKTAILATQHRVEPGEPEQHPDGFPF